MTRSSADFNQKMMQRCLQLAHNGLGNTYPNPLVGAVITHHQKIIGEGWHYQAGLPHAEINAINSVKNKELLKESCLFVNLEPCSHYGKTPPCSLAITNHKIPKVVIGTRDFAAHVNGKGIQILKEKGVHVTENVCQEESIEMNKRFFTFQKKKRPYIILKWAETSNGFFAPETPEQQWITSKKAKALSHLWRTQEQGILVGKNTLNIDQPSLTPRLINGKAPIKITLGKDINFNENSAFFQGEKSLIYTNSPNNSIDNNLFIETDFTQNTLSSILKDLHQKEIVSIIVEGGIKTLQSFIDYDLWDEARVIRSRKVFWSQGKKSPNLHNYQYCHSTDWEEENISFFISKKPTF